MRKLTLFLVVALLCSSCKKDKSIVPGSYSFDGWIITERAMPYTNEIADLIFINEDLGFLVNWDGEIIKITANGERWIKLASFPDYNLRSVFFVDENIGFVAGQEDFENPKLENREKHILLKTINGGENWVKIFVPHELYSIQFMNQMLGYAAVRDYNHDPRRYAAKTTDGGLTWKEIHKIRSYDSRYINFTSKNIGYIIDEGELYKTSDGGDNWKMVLSSGTDYHLCDLKFLNDDDGYAKTSVHIYRTDDGGENWMKSETPFLCPSRSYFSDFNNGFVIEPIGIMSGPFNYEFMGSVVHYTSDGGITWNQSDVLSELYLRKFAFASASVGFGSGYNNKWYRFELK
ncbi:MAG: hypothetical protein IIA45_06390 [Bacteroidetes bacterium]|nr:hypothetical protein [Bacteroidota bacterium]